MLTDTATYIGRQAKAMMEIIADIDTTAPDEDIVEVLIGMVETWARVEESLLFPALEAALEGAESLTTAAHDRLKTLEELQTDIHLGEGAEGPFSTQAKKYIDAVKYHLIVDVQDIAPLAAQLDAHISRELAAEMAAMKADLD